MTSLPLPSSESDALERARRADEALWARAGEVSVLRAARASALADALAVGVPVAAVAASLGVVPRDVERLVAAADRDLVLHGSARD